jgi:hypothetical protein
MSAEKYSLYYCLTRDGWVATEDERTLDGWVRLYEVKVYQRSGWGSTSREWVLTKTNPVLTREEVEQIEEQFPRPKSQRELSPESLKIIGG